MIIAIMIATILIVVLSFITMAITSSIYTEAREIKSMMREKKFDELLK